MVGFNKNDRQAFFNTIIGKIEELNSGDVYCSITLKCGHENTRLVNLSMKREQFDAIKSAIGDKVIVKYFLTSKKKGERWYCSANVLEITPA